MPIPKMSAIRAPANDAIDSLIVSDVRFLIGASISGAFVLIKRNRQNGSGTLLA
jgi:hypothetical protein